VPVKNNVRSWVGCWLIKLSFPMC